MADETQTTQETQFDWHCNFCGQEEGVTNGICPKCGPTQTTPLSKKAKIEAGMEVEEEQPNDKEEVEAEPEPSSTEK